MLKTYQLLHRIFILIVISLIIYSNSVPVEAKNSDFIIEDGMLIKYKGSDTEVIIPDTVNYIEYEAFCGNEKVKKIIIPDTVTYIGASAFEACSSLESVILPEGLTKITNGLFSYCSRLNTVVIPETVVEISSNAFLECKSLTMITIPESVTKIDDQAFKDCNNLATINFPKTTIEFGDDVFKKTEWLKNNRTEEYPEDVCTSKEEVYNTFRLKALDFEKKIIIEMTEEVMEEIEKETSIYWIFPDQVVKIDSKETSRDGLYLFHNAKVYFIYGVLD